MYAICMPCWKRVTRQGIKSLVRNLAERLLELHNLGELLGQQLYYG